MKKRSWQIILLGISLCMMILGNAAAQFVKLPETILPEKIIKAILNEVSGQLPFNNEVMMSGYNRIRKPEVPLNPPAAGIFQMVFSKGRKLPQAVFQGLEEKFQSLEKPDPNVPGIGK